MDLFQDVFFRALDGLRGRRTIERLRFLRQSQYWDRPRLRQWQLERLNELLRQAREGSPFYRERLGQVQLPLRDLTEIQQLPILSKHEIQDNGDWIRAINIPRDRHVRTRTGGSTGQPMHFFWDKQAMDWNRGSVYRSAEWAGTRLGERALHMSGSHYDREQGQRWSHRLAYFLQRYRDCSIAFLTEERLERYYRLLMRFRPASIWGYANGVDEFARFIEAQHPGRDYAFLKAIVTSSEELGPEQRERINRVFGGEKVYDNYGSREMYIGAECLAHDGYHIHAEAVLLEVVDHEGDVCAPGRTGRIVLTDLFNFAFPFIRYEIGDLGALAVPTACRCEVQLPRLQRVDGRIADMVVLPDRVLSPVYFSSLLSAIPGVRSFQVRQDAIDEIKVIIEPDELFDDGTRRQVAEAIDIRTGGQVRVEVVTDERIRLPESGKRRFVVSSVGQGRV